MFFDANEAAAKHWEYHKRPFEVDVFFISYSGFGVFLVFVTTEHIWADC